MGAFQSTRRFRIKLDERRGSQQEALDGAHLSLIVIHAYDSRPNLTPASEWDGSYRESQLSIPIKAIDVEKLLMTIPSGQFQDTGIFSKAQRKVIAAQDPKPDLKPESVEGYADWVNE